MISFNCLECGNELEVDSMETGATERYGGGTKMVKITFRYCNNKECKRYLLYTRLVGE